MKKQIIILRLISALFIVFAIMRLSTVFWAKLNLMIILYALGTATISLVVAVGLLKRWQWSRWLAMALLIFGLANSIVGAHKDIQLLAARYPDALTDIMWVAGVPLWAVIALAIWWLSKSSTKQLFNSKA